MDALFHSETLVAKRKNEWDSLFARISTYTDSKEHMYTRKQNVQFTSLKHGFRKRFANRKKQGRPRKLAFEVQALDNEESDTEVLSDDSSIYSANDELESDISDSESVNSVQYVLQCNEQRKLPDFNTKVENCQTYMLQNGCFNQGVKEKNPNVFIDNSSVNKKALQSDEICFINPVENEQILPSDQSHISHSVNKPLKSILSTKMSENSSRINKKITFSSDPDSEIDIEEFQSDDNVSIKETDNETNHHTSQNSNLSTTENTKTLSTNNIAVNNEVNVNQLNIQNVNNLEKAIYSIKTNEIPKIYSSAARNKRQLSVNSENTVDQISEIKIAKQINSTLNDILHSSSRETLINKEHVTKLTENESLVEIDQWHEQNAELRIDATCKTPAKHKQTAKNKYIIFSTELDCSDNESSVLSTNLSETIVKNEDSIKKQISRSYLSSSSSESDSEQCVNHTNIDLKSNNFEKGKNTVGQEDSKNITNNENQTVYKQVESIKSNRQEPRRITVVRTINSMYKLKNATPKDICKKLCTNTDTSTSLLKETSTDNISEEEHDKENSLPKENNTRIKRKELNKNKETRKMPKKIGMKIFSTETHLNESECNLILKSKSNVLTKNTNNFIRNHTTHIETMDDGDIKKQYLFSSTPNVNVDRYKSSQEECLKEHNVDDEITELFSCDQSIILNQEQINTQKNVDENPSEDDDEIFETIKNKKPGNLNRQQVKSNMKKIIDENTMVNDNMTMSDTVVHLRSNKNGQTDSKNTGILDICSSNEIVNEERPNTQIKSSRKKKSRENIRESPTLSTKPNSNNQSSKIIKCRQRLFNSFSENDNDNCIIKLNSTVLSLKVKQDEFNMDKENSEDLNKDNQTHSLPETAAVISKIQNKSVNEQNEQNEKKRKIGDSNCGSVKQMEKKYKQQQVTLNGTTENNMKQANKHSNNYNKTVDENIPLQENINISNSQSINDECNTKREVSQKKNSKKRRGKCKKEIRFITYSTDDCTNDEDKIWSISSIKNRTPISLEYFLDDDVF